MPATYGRIDPEFLFDCRPSRGAHRRSSPSTTCTGTTTTSGHDHDRASAHRYDSVAFVSELPLRPPPADGLPRQRPDGLYRIKGYVDFGPYDSANRYAVHAVGRFLRFYPEPWAARRRSA